MKQWITLAALAGLLSASCAHRQSASREAIYHLDHKTTDTGTGSAYGGGSLPLPPDADTNDKTPTSPGLDDSPADAPSLGELPGDAPPDFFLPPNRYEALSI